MTSDVRAIRTAAGLLVTLALVSYATASARVPADEQSSAAPAGSTPEEAIEQVIEDEGAVYAGECTATRSPEDIGKRCSRMIAERAGMRAYLAGRTFSEFDTWLFVEPSPDGWRVTAAAPLDFFDTSGAIPWPR